MCEIQVEANCSRAAFVFLHGAARPMKGVLILLLIKLSAPQRKGSSADSIYIYMQCADGVLGDDGMNI